jgi:hypothetical protein
MAGKEGQYRDFTCSYHGESFQSPNASRPVAMMLDAAEPLTVDEEFAVGSALP